jgi:hypothetical protein
VLPSSKHIHPKMKVINIAFLIAHPFTYLNTPVALCHIIAADYRTCRRWHGAQRDATAPRAKAQAGVLSTGAGILPPTHTLIHTTARTHT